MRRAIEANNLCVSYNGNKILNNLSITINEGDFISILGPNGAGKTTLVKALTGVIKDISGEVLLFGKHIHSYNRRELARRVSLLTQSPPVSIPFLVKDIVMMGRFPYLKRFEMEKPRDSAIALNAMELMGIEHFARRHLMELSGGEVKRVFIAQAVAQESSILFLDEPTANLDIGYQIEIFRILKKFNEEMKKTIVLITHDINHAARFAKKIVLLKDGTIVKEGKADAVINMENIQSVFNTEISIKYDDENKPYILL